MVVTVLTNDDWHLIFITKESVIIITIRCIVLSLLLQFEHFLSDLSSALVPSVDFSFNLETCNLLGLVIGSAGVYNDSTCIGSHAFELQRTLDSRIVLSLEFSIVRVLFLLCPLWDYTCAQTLDSDFGFLLNLATVGVTIEDAEWVVR